CAVSLDVVGDLHPRPADPVQFMLQTLGHGNSPFGFAAARSFDDSTLLRSIGKRHDSSLIPNSRFSSVRIFASRINARISSGKGIAPNSMALWMRYGIGLWGSSSCKIAAAWDNC